MGINLQIPPTPQPLLWAVYVCGPNWFAQFPAGGPHKIPHNTRWAYSEDSTVKEPLFVTESHNHAVQVKALLDKTEPVTGKFVEVTVERLERSSWMEYKESVGEKPFKLDRFYPEGCVNGADQRGEQGTLSVEFGAPLEQFLNPNNGGGVKKVDKLKSD